MSTTHDTLTSADLPATTTADPAGRPSSSDRARWLAVPFLAVVILAVGLAAPFVSTAASPTGHGPRSAGASVDDRRTGASSTTRASAEGAAGEGAFEDGGPTDSGGPNPDGPDPDGPDPDGPDPDGPDPDAALPAHLVVPSDLYPAPGDNGIVFLIRNDGGQPLTWSVPQEDAPQPVVRPADGVIAPGDAQLVGFEFPSPVVQADMVYRFTIESNGGTAEVDVHLDALDPVFEIVGGTWNIRNGNTFLVSYGDMDLGLTLKNVGDEMLHVDPQQVDGLAVIGGPWDLAPGQTAYLHLVLCNATYSGGFPDFHDRDFHVRTDGWQGTLDFGVRFTLASGQSALPC